MSSAARKLVDEYNSLPDADRQQVLALILRWAAREPHDLPSDDDLIAAADNLFQELDRSEQQP